jgi:hypothetical protein
MASRAVRGATWRSVACEACVQSPRTEPGRSVMARISLWPRTARSTLVGLTEIGGPAVLLYLLSGTPLAGDGSRDTPVAE